MRPIEKGILELKAIEPFQKAGFLIWQLWILRILNHFLWLFIELLQESGIFVFATQNTLGFVTLTENI